MERVGSDNELRDTSLYQRQVDKVELACFGDGDDKRLFHPRSIAIGDAQDDHMFAHFSLGGCAGEGGGTVAVVGEGEPRGEGRSGEG